MWPQSRKAPDFYRRILLKDFIKRFNSSLNETRVRFAPSPTGPMHIGGLRTAFINYLFAKSRGGTFILRLEDTDRQRFKPESVQSIQGGLEWAGISPDEGPLAGGPCGPYVQSQRLPLYKSVVDTLLTQGSAYRCFCSASRLEIMRREQERRGERQVGYDGKCRHISSTKSQEMAASSMPFVVRFKLESAEVPVFHDLIFGRVEIPIGDIESDPVILKSDGFPVYHLANIVDDHHMRISHVIRGLEWLNSTPKHLLLYGALGWTPPQFAHLPLLLNESGSKISKRNLSDTGSTSSSGAPKPVPTLLEDLRQEGYFPSSVLAWIMSSGSGFKHEHAWTPDMSLAEMVQNFALEKISRHSARISGDMLRLCGHAQFDRAASRAVDSSSEGYHEASDWLTNVAGEATRFLRSAPSETQPLLSGKFHFTAEMLAQLRGRVEKVSDLLDFNYLWDPLFVSADSHKLRPLNQMLKQMEELSVEDSSRNKKKTPPATFTEEDAIKVLGLLENLLKKGEKKWQASEGHEAKLHVLEDLLKPLAVGYSKHVVLRFLRLFFTGKWSGPRISEIVDLIGVRDVRIRISHYLHPSFQECVGDK